MALLPTRLEDVTAEHLQELVDAGVREDDRLDFKLTIPDLDGKNGPKAKRDLLTDVSAFANGGGGDIVMGVEEGRDADNKPNGIAVGIPGVEVENADALERRWTQILEAGLDPRLIPKVRTQVIGLASGRSVIVLRVPRSMASPHMLKEHGWFYARRGPQNLPLSTSELRAAMEVSEQRADRVRRFRDERLAKILADETPTMLSISERVIIHLVPLASAAERQTVDIAQFRRLEPLEAASSWGGRYNADGVAVIADEGQGRSHSYTQFFRDGALEVVTFAALGEPPQRFFPSRFEKLILDAVRSYVPALERAGVIGPLVLLVSIAGLKGIPPADPDRFAPRDGRRPADRDLYTLPDLLIEDGAVPADAHFRTLFDTIWQCFGFERSPNFDAEGRWIERR